MGVPAPQYSVGWTRIASMTDGNRPGMNREDRETSALRVYAESSRATLGTSALAPRPCQTWTRDDAKSLEFARAALRSEADAILAQIDRLDSRFCEALALIEGSRGSVVVTGMGKAGLIGRKLSATLSSTGTPSHFMHPGEAYHGDLGSVRSSDVVLALSYSGETEEIKRLLAPLTSRNIPIIAIVSSASSALGRAATVVLELGKIKEADSLGLAPSSSAAAMLAVGDALALAASANRGFRSEDFARFHPGGALGRKLSRVRECMRPLSQCRVASENATIREVFVASRKPGRRTGAILLVDASGRLSGIFTDSDLAKLFEGGCEPDAFDRPISDVMTRKPSWIDGDALMSDAVSIIAARKISELPALDPDGRPVGILDVTDLVDFFPCVEEGK